MKRVIALAALLLSVILSAGLSVAWGQHDHHRGVGHGVAAKIKDTREFVRFPAALREHTLVNMRDHLLTLQEIQEALGRGQEDVASRLAEQRLGMSSLGLHGAQEVAKYMPKGMQDVGSEMHRNASRFALEVQNAAVTGDLKPALEALSRVTAACVGCHAAYRLH
jgi:hypothetical protein